MAMTSLLTSLICALSCAVSAAYVASAARATCRLCNAKACCRAISVNDHASDSVGIGPSAEASISSSHCTSALAITGITGTAGSSAANAHWIPNSAVATQHVLAFFAVSAARATITTRRGSASVSSIKVAVLVRRRRRLQHDGGPGLKTAHAVLQITNDALLGPHFAFEHVVQGEQRIAAELQVGKLARRSGCGAAVHGRRPRPSRRRRHHATTGTGGIRVRIRTHVHVRVAISSRRRICSTTCGSERRRYIRRRCH
ncbi:hypothetical protein CAUPRSCDRAFT_12076 [Caulochytrium protostelioides]|uniref:Secreted protein n=1 Tax=Caulochytrium protostelioides TaxID=1555241 RepID=A0A4P9WSM8_9FUNG|nr:hypothetical protein CAUPRSCDRAFT_12076 [Caulochytrium protostelioides]